ncbi:signal-transducing adaptor protein 1-like [Hypanus sabinus]|uniref:signal-transducing adaptor protein 1-like n=1 Tax=Hypanus sabinus TaxID=79690 RepID=UPI0028C42CC3|nr:signal-transducing adaptor protein 1-like [Hypanus sabinus]
MKEMAASRTNLRLVFERREKITSLPLYYDGILWKKSTSHKDFQRYWSELRGSSIFFYSDDKDVTYTEKLDLQHFISIGDDSSQAAGFRLHLGNREVKLKAENIETREEWKGYIFVVTQLEVPSTLSLLPGQVLHLKEVAAREKERQYTAPSGQESQCFLVEKPDAEVYDDLLNTMPECFYKVSRNEAEAMLERHPENGSLIIRPSTESSNYSVSIMTTQNSKGIIKHYKVTNEDRGFVIELENPVTYSTLQEVVYHFIKVTNGVLKPYLDSKQYCNKIEMSKDECTKVQKRPLPTSKVVPIQRLSVSPPEYPGARCRGPAKEETEPNYMNNEILGKLNQMNLADDKPPSYTAPKPWCLKHRTKGEDETSELMAKLMKRRERMGDDP